MTMQTTTLPFQVSGANAAPQRPNAAAGAAADGGQQFGATLSREIAQRQPQPQAAANPAPNKPAAPNKAASNEKSSAAQAQRQHGAREAAKPAEAPAAKGSQAASNEGAAESEEAADAAAAAAAAATNPVTDMLAYMASLAQPAEAPVEAAQQPAAATGELQLAALQTAVKNLGLDQGVATLPQDGALPQEEAVSTGFSLATGVQTVPAELQTTKDAAAAQARPEAAPQAQAQLRELPQQAAPVVEEPAPSVAQLQAQAAKLEAVQAPANGADRIPARVGTPAWDNQVSQRIVYMVGKEQAATLTLNPPDLGPVQVVLSVSNDQASVAFSSSQPEVRQALENALPRLREMMGESGIALGNATVDAGTQDQRQAAQNGERGNEGRGNGGWGGDGADKNAADETAQRPARTVTVGERGMVDLFA